MDCLLRRGRAANGRRIGRRVAAAGAVAAMAAAAVVHAQVPAFARPKLVTPGGEMAAQAILRPATTAPSWHQIILPDLLIVAPKGLTSGQIARLRALAGVRDMVTFAGAEIRAGGVPVSVIGIDPASFRPWVPLQVASDQAFWSALASGEFVAATGVSKALRLKPGDRYPLAGAATQTVRFGLAATLGLTGVDLLVNQALSARLGLVRQVASLISAPDVSIATLRAEVGRVLGPTGRIEVLRSQQPPAASVPAGARPASYLELFKASAADYCPGLSWTVLAAIGQIESADGQNMGPSSAGALGPMQFLPSTWQAFGIDGFGQTGPPNVMNPYDAVPSAALLLCADGAAAGGEALANAIYDYNHSDAYVRAVLALAVQYAADYGS